MKHAALILLLLASPALAEEEDTKDLLERGAQMILEGLLQELEPTLEDLNDLGDRITPALRDFVAEMGPTLSELIDQVEDWSAYHPPEILDNGDIIIRRKQDQPDVDDIEI